MRKIKCIEDLINEIKEKLVEVNINEGSTVTLAVEAGEMFNTLKKKVKKAKKSWEECLKEIFPQKSIRTHQIYMCLAREVDLDEDPGLALLGLKRLYNLEKAVKDEAIVDVLEKNDIDIPDDSEDLGSVENFKLEVDDLIKDLKKQNAHSKESSHKKTRNPKKGNHRGTKGKGAGKPRKGKKQGLKGKKRRETPTLLKQFTKSVETLTEQIDSIIDDEDIIEELDFSIIAEIETKLSELKEACEFDN